MDTGPAHKDEALQRLNARIDAFAASAQRKPRRADDGSGAGYKVIGELVGGVLAGLGFGWTLDRLAGTSPLGLIGGLLIGTGTSVFLVVRSAGRMSAAIEKTTTGSDSANTPPKAPEDDED
jgi:ATP synthase protein I